MRKKWPLKYALVAMSVFLVLSGGGMLTIAFLKMEGFSRWTLAVCGTLLVLFVLPIAVMAAQSGRRRENFFLGEPPIDVSALDRSRVQERLEPYVALVLSRRQKQGLIDRLFDTDVPREYELLVLPYWFLRRIEEMPESECAAMLGGDKELTDHLCERLAAVGLDEAARQLQSAHADGPEAAPAFCAWVVANLPAMWDMLLAYIRTHITEYGGRRA